MLRAVALIRLHRALSSAAAAETPRGLRVTERCAARLRALEAQRNVPVALRVAVDGGGCSGFQYAFEVEELPSVGAGAEERKPENKNDMVFGTEQGAQVRVDPVSYAFIKGASVDYIEELISSSFRVVDNPNSEASCGCGTSFTAKM
jgi:iron-sulfur cluster assembly accessory protein